MFDLFALSLARHRYDKVQKQITSSGCRCYFVVEPRVVFTTRLLLPAIKTDVLLLFNKAISFTNILCVSPTSKMFSNRIKQHVPKSIRTGHFSQDQLALSRSCKSSNYSVSQDSDIGQHLADNQMCAHHYNNDRFFTFSTDRSSFPPSALKATFIGTL